MTRINVVPVETLSRLHLISEYRELPRVFALAHKASISNKPWSHKQPAHYCMSTGHVLFFYDKLGWLANRHKQITEEMISRGYKPSFTGCLRDEWEGRIPKGYWKDWKADSTAIGINSERITKRLNGDKS